MLDTLMPIYTKALILNCFGQLLLLLKSTFTFAHLALLSPGTK